MEKIVSCLCVEWTSFFSLFVDDFQCYANKKHSHEHLDDEQRKHEKFCSFFRVILWAIKGWIAYEWSVFLCVEFIMWLMNEFDEIVNEVELNWFIKWDLNKK